MARTAAPLPHLTFTEADVPVTTVKRSNPFDDKIGALAESMGDNDRSARAVVVTVPSVDAKRVIGLAQNSGRFHGVSVRQSTVESGKGRSTITLWTVPAIRRNSRSEDGE